MTGPVAIVTGAARGIGLAITDLFLAEGRRVVMVDRDAEELVRASNNRTPVMAVPCDVSDPEQVSAMAARAAEWAGRIDVVVNNAGVADFRPLAETDFATWQWVMKTNLDGVFLVSQATIPHLARQGGAIVNIASISGLRASTLRVAYGTSKAAVMHLTRQQAAELGEQGIRANCVCPGPVDTKLAKAVHSPQIRAAYHDAIPLNRYGSEREIAELVVFLAADGGFEATDVGLPALRR